MLTPVQPKPRPVEERHAKYVDRQAVRGGLDVRDEDGLVCRRPPVGADALVVLERQHRPDVGTWKYDLAEARLGARIVARAVEVVVLDARLRQVDAERLPPSPGCRVARHLHKTQDNGAHQQSSTHTWDAGRAPGRHARNGASRHRYLEQRGVVRTHDFASKSCEN